MGRVAYRLRARGYLETPAKCGRSGPESPLRQRYCFVLGGAYQLELEQPPLLPLEPTVQLRSVVPSLFFVMTNVLPDFDVAVTTYESAD